MFCAYCGTNNPDDAAFCLRCGRRQDAATENTMSSASPSEEALGSRKQLPREGMPMTVEAVHKSMRAMEETTASAQNSTPLRGFIPQSAISPTSLRSSLPLQQNVGALVSGVGGLLGLFTFFFLPYLSLGIFGSLTGSQLASANNQFIQGTGALWLEPLLAVVVVGIAGYLMFGNQRNSQGAKGLTITLIALASVALVVLFIKYAIDAQPPNGVSNSDYSGPTIASYYGSGMWVYFIAMLVVLGGGIGQMISLAKK